MLAAQAYEQSRQKQSRPFHLLRGRLLNRCILLELINKKLPNLFVTELSHHLFDIGV